MGFKDPTKHVITYGCIWQRDSIKFYYDGQLVREITDKNILNRLENTKMNVIINNGVTDKVDYLNAPESDFEIHSFRYSPILYNL